MSKKTSNKTSKIKNLFTNRNTRRGAISVSVTVLVVVALILVNVIFGVMSDRKAMYIDVTANRSYKLQGVTVDYISDLDKDVDIYVFANEEDLEKNDSVNYQYYLQANRLLHEFEYNSDKIKLHYVDLVKNPTFLSKYPNVDRNSTYMLMVVCGDEYVALEPPEVFSYDTEAYQQQNMSVVKAQHVEQAVTSAILKVTDTDHVSVSVLTGQGEADCTAFTTRLTNNAYEVDTVDLEKDDLTDTNEFLIIFKPQADIDDKIYKKISEWLNAESEYSHNIVYFPNDDYPVKQFTNLNALLADYGMEVDYSYILEYDDDYIAPLSQRSRLITLFEYGDPSFTDALRDKSKKVIMGGAKGTMPVKILDKSIATELLLSSSSAQRLDIEKQEPEVVDSALCGAAVSRKTKSSIVVIGSADAVSSAYLYAETYNNENYFVNIFNVLSHKDDAGIIIEGKDPSSTELGISSVKDLRFLSALVRFIIPGLVIVIGIIIWFRRRHR